jgi:fibronectin type 3 domain-containing protein
MKRVSAGRRSAAALLSLALLSLGVALSPWLVSSAQAAGLAIGTRAAGQTSSGSSVSTAAFSTSQANELLVAFISADGPSRAAGQSFTGVTGGGLTWQLRQRANAQYGTAEIWTAAAPAALQNVTVTASHSGSDTAAIQVVAFTGANTTAAAGATAGASGSSGAPTASLKTTAAGGWVWAAGDDWDNATARTVGSNQTLQSQTLASSGDTFWSQSQTSPTAAAGTAVSINDTAPTKDRWNLALLEITPGGATTDTTPPSTPTHLIATSPDPSHVSLSWSASTDDVGVAGYDIYRNGSATPLATGVTQTSYTDATVASGTSYSYTVAAYDAAGNLSVQSAPASVMTGTPDTTPPSVQMTAPADGSTVLGPVTVAASASDNVAVASVQFQLTNLTTYATTNLGAAVTSSPYQTTWNASAVSNGQYALSAVATDTSGNTATAGAVDVTVTNAANAAATAPTIDPATPGPTAVLNNVTATTSPAFSPPANTVIYAAFSMDSASYEGTITTVSTITNTGTPLVWHLLGRNNAYSSSTGGFLEVWWADNPSAQTGITAKATFSQATKNVTPPVGDFQILVMDNAAADQSGAAWAQNSLLTGQNNAPYVNVTTTKPNSQVFALLDNWNNASTPVPGSGQSIQSIVLNTQDVDGYWLQQEKSPTANAGTTVLMSATDPGQSNSWRTLAWEVLGA